MWTIFYSNRSCGAATTEFGPNRGVLDPHHQRFRWAEVDEFAELKSVPHIDKATKVIIMEHVDYFFSQSAVVEPLPLNWGPTGGFLTPTTSASGGQKSTNSWS